MSTWKWSLSLIAAASLALTACGDQEETAGGDANSGTDAAPSQEASQVIAKVGGTEITVHQLNVELAQFGQVENPDLARRQALEAIVYRTALSQAAKKDKLDRNPDVLIRVEALKDKTLAEAYLRSQTSSTPPPTTTEIDDYMLQHPMMFDRRRVYEFFRVVMPRMAYAEELKAFIDEKADLTELEAELKNRGVNYQADEAKILSSQFPEDVQMRLPTYSETDSLVLHADATVAVLKIRNWTEVPLPREQSMEVARQILFQKAVQKRAESTREKILSNSKISFFGDFEDMTVTGPVSLELAEPVKPEAAKPVAPVTSDIPEGQ